MPAFPLRFPIIFGQIFGQYRGIKNNVHVYPVATHMVSVTPVHSHEVTLK